MKLLYIDSCIRDEASRTKRIADPIVAELRKRYEIETLCINELPLEIVKKDLLHERMDGHVDDCVLQWANAVKAADRIVISAPFWDMSFPAALRVFFELCSLADVTFKDNGKTCYGNCRCQKVLFITTRGMDIPTGDPREQASSYLQALSWLWGLGPIQVVSAQNMDYVSPTEVQKKIETAIEEGFEICRDF